MPFLLRWSNYNFKQLPCVFCSFCKYDIDFSHFFCDFIVFFRGNISYHQFAILVISIKLNLSYSYSDVTCYIICLSVYTDHIRFLLNFWMSIVSRATTAALWQLSTFFSILYLTSIEIILTIYNFILHNFNNFRYWN